jgi:sugar lactone lactonase YvrE
VTITKAETHKLTKDCCELGEGPHYDAASDTAWWFDIVGKKLFEHALASGETTAHDLPRMASVVARIDASLHV